MGAAGQGDAARDGRDVELLRAELFSLEQLKRHAVAMARQHRLSAGYGPDRLLPRLADNARVLLEAHDVVTAAAATGQRVMPAESWLLDNFYLIEQQISQARRHLPRGYSRQLPRLSEGPLAGFPRIYDLALELISHMDGRVDGDTATQFIAAYQSVEPLRIGELWAFPIMLQLALLENLRRVGVSIARRRRERDAALAWADRMLVTAEQEPKALIRLLDEFARADVPLTAPFVEAFDAVLQTQGPALAFIQTWMEHKLLEQGVTAEQLLEVAGRTAASNQISMANNIGSLRFINGMDWKDFVESLSVVEQILRDDPMGLHARQDFATRDRYRHVVEDMARAAACPEPEVARAAIELARIAAARGGEPDRSAHIGYYLIGRGRTSLEQAVGCCVPWPLRLARRCRPAYLSLYLGTIALLTLLGTGGVWWILDGSEPDTGWVWGLTLPLLIAVSALTISLVNLVLTLLLPPKVLPRLDFSSGIPEVWRTMVIVPTLLTGPKEVDRLLDALEIRYLGNRDPHLFFALLTDFCDAPQENQPGDAALLERVRMGVERLNRRYQEDRPGIFYLFHRPRVWNPIERVWMGYERKRGKIEQFNARLRGEAVAAFSEIVGDTRRLASIRFVITLDTDTQLPRDAARQLVGNLAHPLNRPVHDPGKGRVTEGHGILQPRTSISLSSAHQSRFSRLMAGEPGMDPYTREVSDVYQDLFGEGSFVGKGIYDVDTFRRAIEGRLPENLILSHDLLEGGYARSGLVTDVDLLEEHPPSYTAEANRRHRWIRGDWHLVAWLLPWVPAPRGHTPSWVANPLSVLSRWKLFDNLRRSLVAPSLLALLLGGWLLGVGPVGFWSLLVVALVVLPALLPAMIDLWRRPQERVLRIHLNLTGRAAAKPLAQALLNLAFLPYDARIGLGAIACSLGRMPFTWRGLLLWHLPSYVRRNACRTPADFFWEMGIAPVLALCTGAALAWRLGDAWVTQGVFAAPLLVLWLVSPGIGWWISQAPGDRLPRLSASQAVFLRRAARRTWRYFADFVGPEDHWLPPDNFQETPEPMVASRTSPTNIGMALLSDLAAHDFGYVTTSECLARIEQTLSTLERLERYRGHLYNWYDTRTLEPLHPRYVSSVDSGNLLGALLTLQAGLAELKHRPVPSPEAFQGLLDTLGVLAEEQSVPSPPLVALEGRVQQLRDVLQEVVAGGGDGRGIDVIQALEAIQQGGGAAATWGASGQPAHDEASVYWGQAFDRQVAALRDELAHLLPEGGAVAAGCPSRMRLAEAGAGPARAQLDLIDDLIRRCRSLAIMDFDFLYDTPSGLLAIGYDVSERRRDPACYDLLASESRLASFLLIAQGQLPQKHWFALGRLLTRHGGDVSLISWSGSMFEYLMPQLIMPTFGSTLLAQTCKAAVSRHIEYGRQRAVPWGISESCYNVTDMHQVYQYRAFGVPGLGFKRGLGEDLVIAPYATALALTVLPRESCRNLERMAETGFVGSYGFYEAVDYTPSRVPRGRPWYIVRSFMAHHQGMTLLAFAHVLLGQPMQRRFMADPQVRATELLLQERVPRQGAILHPHAAEVSASAQRPDVELGHIMRVFKQTTTLIPEVHLLSNGRYHVMATHAGGGYSRRHGLAVTRWREDATTDAWGTFIYLRDRDSGQYWSCAHQPTLRSADHYEAIFVQARAEYRRQDEAIDAHTEISVSPEDDVEIRRVTLTNQSARTRHIEMTSYAEVVLAPLAADLAHRAFSNLFVQTEILPDHQAILCTRRRRTPEEQVPWMIHLMAAPGAVVDAPSFETDRARFIGRGRTPVNPVVLDAGPATGRLSNTAGAVLDPIVAIRRTVTLAPDESASVQIITGIADTREEALTLLEKYCDRHFVERAFEMAWFHSQEMLRALNADEADAQVYGRLANSVVFGSALRRAAPGVITRNQLGQPGLWRFAISGDLPIVLLHVGDIHRIDRVKQVLQAHAYWRMKGLIADLVILNEDFSGYRAVLQDRIMGLIHSGPEAQMLDRPGGVFLRRAEELSEDERVLLQTVARIVFSEKADTLIEPVERRVSATRRSDWLEPVRPVTLETPPPALERELIFNNGLGGFTPDGREYVITLAPGQQTPAPWVNVIAGPRIGTVVSEGGSAYTWVDNAHEFRLTHWHNDPLSDTSGEAFYIRDEETGAFWSPTPLPARGRNTYVCRHGFGYSVFEYQELGIASELTLYVALDAPVKCAVIKLHNHSRRSRRLSVTGYWELVLGEWRHANLMHIVTEMEPHTGALLARNAYSREFSQRRVFAHVSGRDRSISGGRTEFIGRNGSMASPAAMRRKRLSGRTGAGLDPCAAVQGRVVLEAGQSAEVVFLFGAASSVEEVEAYIQGFGGRAGAQQALEGVWAYWDHTLGAVRVETPDAALDVLANGWLLYQTLSSRLWARSGYYQSGGAYGFRDQLQDVMALIHTTPDLARAQLIRCAGRQFLKGDVQHWWHPPGGQGVRTHFSDDYLWLPYVTCHYVAATGDTGVLDESVHFLEGRDLNPDEEAYYNQPQRSPEAASLYEHCVRALRHGLRFGAHQLPLMGGGDWNDGMNRVGHEGRGESVWLAWFLFDALKRFADLARDRGDGDFAGFCLAQAGQLRGHIEASAWDGAWYRRAWFDDGTPLGSATNAECRIDAISQSWAILSGAGEPGRARQAMEAVDRHLVNREDGLIRLLAPPFDQSTLEPGYIKGYVPGVRENGGQYTHAAIWTTMAFARMGDTRRAWACYDLLNPIHHGDTPEAVARYKVEPYVMSADVYGAPPHTGRGGWTWYTGAAGWMYRLILETLLGLELRGDHLRLTPCIPDHWDGYTLHYRYRETPYQIRVSGAPGEYRRVLRVTLDGTEIRDADAHEAGWGRIPLVEDGRTHHVEVELG